MIDTVSNIRNKQNAFVNTIKTCIEELKRLNNEIEAQKAINENSVNQHNKDIEQLVKDNKELDALRDSNETFIDLVEEILAK